MAAEQAMRELPRDWLCQTAGDAPLRVAEGGSGAAAWGVVLYMNPSQQAR